MSDDVAAQVGEYEVRVAVQRPSRVGEGPFWDPADHLLVWVDILSGHIHRSDIFSGHTTSISVPGTVGAVVTRTSGGYLIAAGRELRAVDVDWRTSRRWQLLDEGHRMNDAACDAHGRLWFGSCRTDFAPGHGVLRVLDCEGTVHERLRGLSLPNGIGWDPTGETCYLVDTVATHVLAFDARDREPEPWVLCDLRDEPGRPDGLCVDTGGDLWVAMWGGAAVLRIAADGSVVGRYEMPVRQPTSCAFVGDALDALAVTSAREGLSVPADALDGSVLLLAGIATRGQPVPGYAG